MDSQKVAWLEAKASGNDDYDNYDGDDGVKFQIEWLPLEGSVPEFFEHLNRSMEAYSPHAY